MSVKLHPGQLDALRAIAARGTRGTVPGYVAANLHRRGMIAAPAADAELTTAGLEALADAARAVCHHSGCTLTPGHRNDHIDADGYRSINFDDWN